MVNNLNTPPEDNTQNDVPTQDLQNQPALKNNEQSVPTDAVPDSVDQHSSLESSAEKLASADKNPAANVDPSALKLGKSSTQRLMSNGKIRFFIFAGGITALLLSYGAYKVFSPAEEKTVVTPNEVSVPRSHAEASAISSPEQAEHLRNLQNQQADEADKNGQTFVAGFITEADPTVTKSEEDLTAGPTQPGASLNAEEPRIFFDAQGKKYTKEEALSLYQSGYNIPGVTHGSGSISDASLNDNSANMGSKPGSKKSRDKKTPEPTYQSYVVEPYTPNASGATSSERSTTGETQLDNAAQNTENWANEYLALRQKKAQMIDEKTQYAFEQQIDKYSQRIKSTDKTKVMGYQNITYANPSIAVPVSESNNKPSTTAVNKQVKVLIYAGQTSRAILKTQVNSDQGLEVIALIVSGPLKNALVTGTATVTEDNMRFSFNKVLRQGKDEMQISATAREIGTNSLSMADEVNKHYLKRVGSLVASSVLSGVGQAYEQTAGVAAQVTGTTVVTNTSDPSNDRIAGNVIGEVGDMLSSEFKNGVNRKPTVIANSGKVFNLFFNQNVYDTPNGMPSKN